MSEDVICPMLLVRILEVQKRQTIECVMLSEGAQRVLQWTANATLDEQFWVIDGQDRARRQRVDRDLAKLRQELSNKHVAKLFSQPKHDLSWSTGMLLTLGEVLDVPQYCQILDSAVEAKRLW